MTTLLLALLLVLFALPASARTTTRWPETGLLVDRWTVEDGLPVDHIVGLDISPAGFVWMATMDGLVRFDGERFRVVRRADTPALPTNRFLDVVADAEERLWAITETYALLYLDGQRVRSWGGLEDRYTTLQRVQGEIWAVREGQGLVRVQDGEPRAVPGVRVNTELRGLASVDGALWLAPDTGGLWRIGEDGVARVVAGGEALDVSAIVPDPAGGAWIGAGDGLWRLDAGALRPLATPRPRQAVCGLYADPGAATPTLWVNDLQGWWAWDGRRIAPVGPTTAAAATCVRPPARALNGQLWQARDQTLVRGWDDALTLGGWARAFEGGPDGAIWVASNAAGLYRLRAPSVEMRGEQALNLQSLLLAPDGTWWARRYVEPLAHLSAEGEVLELADEIAYGARGRMGLGLGPEGRVWVALQDRTCVIADDSTCDEDAPAHPPTGFDLLLLGRDGRVWMTVERTLHMAQVGPAGWTWAEVPTGGALADGKPLAIEEAPDGAIWLATRGAGAVRVGPTETRRWGRSEGLSSDTARAVWVGPDGVAWVGTEDAGLCRVDPAGGAPFCLGQAQGLYDDALHSVRSDDAGRLWISSNRGIFWVQRAQLEDLAAGRRASVLSVGLSERDGMRSREANGGVAPAVVVDARGRLSYPTQAGLAQVDPARVPTPAPPAVFLDEILVSGHPMASPEAGPLVLSSDQRELVARWTTPPTAWPEQVRFRHRLVGASADWSAPSGAREARWTSLPPGTLRLEIQAALGGDWGPTSAIEIERQPGFVETRWFLAALGLSGLALGGLGLAWQGARSRQRQAELEALVAARTVDLATSNQALAEAARIEAAQADRLREQSTVLERQNRELAAATARLEEVDALRTRLIADLSHELRTPLMLIAGPLEDLASSGALAEAPAQRTLDVVLENTRRLENLVEQLLDVARLEGGRIPLRVRHRDLTHFLRRLAARFEPECQRKRLRLELDLSDAPSDLFFDAELLEKVVSNLLSNALKFTAAGGVITLGLRNPTEDDSAVRVEVRDTGVGISEALRERLFDRFVQGERGDARRFEGVGIGLALARDLVNLHGGEIGVESEPGQGSRFWFTLPRGVDHLAPEDVGQDAEPASGLAAPVESRPVEPAAAATQPEGARPRVLVVEDHPDMRDFLVAHLARRFEVVAAASGEEALARAREAPPAAIVSDVMMPGMDGLELCRRLDADPALREIPVLLASAKASEDDRVSGLEVADDYMTKPLRMRELLARVQKLVDRAPTTPEPEEAPVPDEGLVEGLGAADLALRTRIEAAVAKHLSDPDFGVEQMARALAFSRRQLLREVQRVTGQSPSDLLRARRMEEGHRLLVAGEVSTVAEAAARIGLSAPYFSRTFTAWYKRAPSDLLQRGRV